MGRPGSLRAGWVAVALTLLLPACGGPRGGADALLDRFAASELAAPPPGGTEVGRVRDRGDGSGVTGSPAALLLVHASPLPHDRLLQEYRDRFGERHALAPFGVDTPTSSALLGRLDDPDGTVQLTASSTPPDGAGDLRPAPPGTRSWVLVRLQEP